MYHRRIEINVEMVKPVGFRALAEFEDVNHHIRLNILFQFGTGKVLEAEAEALRAPFPECRLGVQAIKNLIGYQAVNFKSGKEIFQLVAGPEGCTHLAELVVESVKARISSAEHIRPDWIDPELIEARYRQWENSFADTCIHFSEPYWKPLAEE